MRYLILSDIHANLEALEAVLAQPEPVDAVLVLGDLIGYGADPNAVVARLRALPVVSFVRGNHDKVGSGVELPMEFNHLARRAIEWTRQELTPENRAWVAALPEGPMTIDADVEICHGSPFDEDAYLFDELDARRAFNVSRRQVCLFGHTHVPTAYRFDAEMEAIGPLQGARFHIRLLDGTRYLVNCGAVGQPRDGDPRAAYGLLDTGTAALTISRVVYDVTRAQAKILEAGLPERLAQRLAVGR